MYRCFYVQARCKAGARDTLLCLQTDIAAFLFAFCDRVYYNKVQKVSQSERTPLKGCHIYKEESL